MKNLVKSKRAEGFTIIEVMIVLAIAGLIMVIVFLAVPQLQRNQRDNTRQSIANRTKAEMETYAGNNQGNYPFGNATNVNGTACNNTTTGCWLDFVNRYITGKVNVNDPSTGNADISNATLPAPCTVAGTACSNGAPATAGQVVIVYGAKCNGEAFAVSGGNGLGSRTYAIMIGLDRANTTYCVDNG